MSLFTPPRAMARLMRADREDWLDPGNVALCIGHGGAIAGPYLLAGHQIAFELQVLGQHLPPLDAAFRAISGAHGPQLGIDVTGGLVFAALAALVTTPVGLLLHYLRPAAREKLRAGVTTALATRRRNALVGMAGAGLVLWLAPYLLAALIGGPDTPKLILATLLLVVMAAMTLSGAVTRMLVDHGVAPSLRRRDR